MLILPNNQSDYNFIRIFDNSKISETPIFTPLEFKVASNLPSIIMSQCSFISTKFPAFNC